MTKTFLVVIAVGLWANVASEWLGRAHAESDGGAICAGILTEVTGLQLHMLRSDKALSDVKDAAKVITEQVGDIDAGTCSNKAICQK